MEAFIRSKGVLFLCLLLLSASLHSFAIDERYAAKPLSGNQLRKDSFSIVQDSAFYDNTLRPFQISYAVRNLVTFRINEFANLKLPDTFNVSITFKIFYTRKIGDTTGVSDSTSAITLTIGYNKNSVYDGKALYTFKGGYSSKVSITNVTVNYGTLSAIENSLLLENEIQVTREYLFSCTNNAVDTVSNTDLSNSKGELKVYWTKERPEIGRAHV